MKSKQEKKDEAWEKYIAICDQAREKYKAKIKEIDMENEITFAYEHFTTQEEVREHIKECEGKHTQQAIYSTFHDCLTQICFDCIKIRSTL